jgi:hypothetical protein
MAWFRQRRFQGYCLQWGHDLIIVILSSGRREMRPILARLITITFLSIIASAQYGTAPNNYYPVNYSGNTFTGTVTHTLGDEITLTFVKGSKTETFVGRLETGCSVPSKDGHPMRATDIPGGTVVTAFFNGTTKKVDGKRIKENVIIAIAFDVWQGHTASEDKKMIYSCTDQRQLKFRAF